MKKNYKKSLMLEQFKNVMFVDGPLADQMRSIPADVEIIYLPIQRPGNKVFYQAKYTISEASDGRCFAMIAEIIESA